MAAQPGDVELGVIDIVATVLHGALNFDVRHQIVHAVERFQECGLAAAGGTDQSRDLMFGNLDVNPLERMVFSVI